jgi:hypothetical protein
MARAEWRLAEGMSWYGFYKSAHPQRTLNREEMAALKERFDEAQERRRAACSQAEAQDRKAALPDPQESR